jgi:hypothetical protein
MKKHHRGLVAATLALFGYVAIPAQADTLNMPISAAFMNSGDGSGCQIWGWPDGIGPKELGAICDFEFPMTIPAGHTVQQIEVIHSGNLGFITAFLGTLDFATSATAVKLQWLSNNSVPPGTYEVSPLITSPKQYFVVQPNTTYRVVLHLEDGGDVAGLRITYQ